MHSTLTTGTYDPFLVALSVAIAVAASYTALDLAGRVRASTGWTRRVWLTTAAVAMGGGIWAMHFVAMLAFRMAMPVTYDPGMTLLSLVLPILVTGVGFAVVGRSGVGRPGGHRPHGFVLSGLLMGSGIVAMHYTGMAAMRMPADLSYDARLVAASILIAIVASIVALWLTSLNTTGWLRIAAATCMGFAVSAMHYTGMEAAVFAVHGAAHEARGQADIDPASLAMSVAAVAFLILLFALVASLFDRRFAALAEREAAALRESEERFRTLYRSTPLPLHSLDAEENITQISDAWLELLGYRREDVVGRPITVFMTPDSAERRRSRDWPQLLASGELREAEYDFLTRTGQVVTVLLSARIQRDATGAFVRTLGGMVDVTAHRQAEEALRRAQRMEAVGQLTGGVAHDFNNLLTAILGSFALLERHVAGNERARRLLEMGRQAVHRGANLSQALLAFARRQPLHPEPVDANALLDETATLIRRALGETVELELAFDPRLPPCQADAAQLQAAVLNLALNARDAMPGGGTLSIRTAVAHLSAADLAGNEDARPGPYVMLVVRDTGHGMTPEVLARAFDPFFTTKEAGKGTGLGLSQVYGFARQLGGHVVLASVPGHGTTVTLYLPLAERALATVPNHEGAEAGPLSARPVTRAASVVLVVEDEAPVREATAEVLREAGWRVLTACNGPEALAVLEAGEAVNVLFSDVVMPGGMTGPEVARTAQRLRPGIGVLLTSGYAGAALASDGNAFELLAKPYGRADLLSRLAATKAGECRILEG